MSASTAAPSPPAPADPVAAPDPAPADTYRLFRRIVPPELINQRQPSASQAVYTAFVTVWLLIYQRLHGGASLDEAVSALLFTFPKEDLPHCKRLDDNIVSANNSGYSRGRKRLDPELPGWLADRVFDTLHAGCRPSWKNRRVMLLDGSTFSLAPTKDLREAFPPASNQYGPSHWPILHVVVAHDLDTGLVCRPEYGPMYGEDCASESSLTLDLLPRLPPYSLLLADGNFGIFLIAYNAATLGTHDVLLHLSEPRFRSLLKEAQRIGVGRWEVKWHPSPAERKKYGDGLPEDAEVRGYLAEVEVGKRGERKTLYLFTTLREGTNFEWGELYGRRWCVETDIGAGKVTLGLGAVTSKTKEMVEKEVVLATVAYNLIVQVRRLAAEKAGVGPRRLSFTGTRSLLNAFEARVAVGDLSEEDLQRLFDKLLRACGQRKVPNRPGRKFPRELIPRRRRYTERKRRPPDPSLLPGSGPVLAAGVGNASDANTHQQL
jgi:hypothetical protein